MADKIDINKVKRDQFNRMYEALNTIAKEYYPAISLRMLAEDKYGLDPDEAIDEAYENMRADAAEAIKGIHPFNKKNGVQ